MRPAPMCRTDYDKPIRRIVTTHDASGKAVFLSDFGSAALLVQVAGPQTTDAITSSADRQSSNIEHHVERGLRRLLSFVDRDVRQNATDLCGRFGVADQVSLRIRAA